MKDDQEIVQVGSSDWKQLETEGLQLKEIEKTEIKGVEGLTRRFARNVSVVELLEGTTAYRQSVDEILIDIKSLTV